MPSAAPSSALERSSIFRPLSTPALFSALAPSQQAMEVRGGSASCSPSSEATTLSKEEASVMSLVRQPADEAAFDDAHSLALTAASIPSRHLPSNKPRESRKQARFLRAKQRNRTLGLATSFAPASLNKADLGDDDSFSPEIVSGYHFNLPLEYDTTVVDPTHPPVSPAPDPDHPINPANPANPANPLNLPTDYVRPLDLGNPHDLGDDDEYFGEDPLPYDQQMQLYTHEAHRTHLQNSTLDSDHDHDHDHDHREDAVYDDLDDIGDWVANTAPGGLDLTKRMMRAVGKESAPNPATNMATAALTSHERTENRRRENQLRDKFDRATTEQVFDSRTRNILFRLLARNRLRTLNGCVSTGKEANVYHGTAASDPSSGPDGHADYPPNPSLMPHDYSPDTHVAVKVFKTSILQFKDRERYVQGEFRFRRSGYQRSSNRKMVQQWAEKEFRNQIRLQEAGVPGPIPLLLKPPVLVMSFFGKDGWPAPKLKDADLSPSRLSKVYTRVCLIMRQMFQVARLVHGDLSEYNMLYWKGDVVIIDVSQSVEDDHPMALDFLRRDCANVNDFFRRAGNVQVLSVRELFDFVTGKHIGASKDEVESALKYLIEMASGRDMESMRLTQQDDEVFMRAYIPRTLQEVELQDKQFRGQDRDNVDGSFFAKLTGLSITQKRSRSRSRSKSTSMGSEGSHTGTQEAEMARQEQLFSVEPAPCGNDEIDLTSTGCEPATFRTLPTNDTRKVGVPSPCTSNGSSKQNAENPKKLSPSQSIWEKQRIALENIDSMKSRPMDDAIGDIINEDDTFDASARSEASSSDEWVRRSREESSDPYMGLGRKEWKKRVKAEARERRQQKTPKHVKKRKELLAKRHRKGQK